MYILVLTDCTPTKHTTKTKINLFIILTENIHKCVVCDFAKNIYIYIQQFLDENIFNVPLLLFNYIFKCFKFAVFLIDYNFCFLLMHF